jgi:hypothetical protein
VSSTLAGNQPPRLVPSRLSRLIPGGQDTGLDPGARRKARAAAALISLTVLLILAVAVQGPSAAVPWLPAASGWPSWFMHTRPPDVEVTLLIWLSVLTGGAGTTLGLLAVRHGWRPRPRRLIAACLLAVIALMVTSPIGSTDILDYVVYGRTAAIGVSPYILTPLELQETGDPVGQIAPVPWQDQVSVYGPLATASERAASELAGKSSTRTIFWIKVWNALAFLAVALALDRFLRSDGALRARAHLLWSVNPLMLFAVISGGHVDGLGAAAGVAALLWFRRPSARRGLASGVLAGLAVAVKAPFALFGAGLAWASRRSPRALAALGLGAAAVIVPSYLLAGEPSVAALVDTSHGSTDLYQPWQLLTWVFGWPDHSGTVNTIALAATLVLAVYLIRRLPAGLPGLPAVQPALALTFAWLICSPQQRPWFDAMLFPLLAVMPVTRLDWVAILRIMVATAAELPGLTYLALLHPRWLSSCAEITSRWIAPVGLVLAAAALLYLCSTRRWARPLSFEPEFGQPSFDRQIDDAAQAGQHAVDGERGQRASLEVADQESHRQVSADPG